MKPLISMIAAIAVASLAACSQDPRMAALEQQMQAQLQQLMASGASPEQLAAFQANMMQQVQAMQATIAQNQMEGMNAMAGLGMAPGGYAEPTEAEMRSVFEGTLDNAKARVDNMADQCNNVRSTKDPTVGIACLLGMVGQSQSAQVGLSSFQKIGCEKSSKPGYNCDYIIGISAAGLSAFGGGGREAQSRRFVKSDGRWIAMEY